MWKQVALRCDTCRVDVPIGLLSANSEGGILLQGHCQTCNEDVGEAMLFQDIVDLLLQEEGEN